MTACHLRKPWHLVIFLAALAWNGNGHWSWAAVELSNVERDVEANAFKLGMTDTDAASVMTPGPTNLGPVTAVRENATSQAEQIFEFSQTGGMASLSWQTTAQASVGVGLGQAEADSFSRMEFDLTLLGPHLVLEASLFPISGIATNGPNIPMTSLTENATGPSGAFNLNGLAGTVLAAGLYTFDAQVPAAALKTSAEEQEVFADAAASIQAQLTLRAIPEPGSLALWGILGALPIATRRGQLVL